DVVEPDTEVGADGAGLSGMRAAALRLPGARLEPGEARQDRRQLRPLPRLARERNGLVVPRFGLRPAIRHGVVASHLAEQVGEDADRRLLARELERTFDHRAAGLRL